jgi:hypothetical protein
MNRDFVEMLSALCAAGADFLVVGAHAVAAHGRPRATGDLDLWVRPSPANADRVLAALGAFGAPLFGHLAAQQGFSSAPRCERDALYSLGGRRLRWRKHRMITVRVFGSYR